MTREDRHVIVLLNNYRLNSNQSLRRSQIMRKYSFQIIVASLFLTSSVASPQQAKNTNAAVEWIEVVPERKSIAEGKRIRKYDSGLVLEVMLLRDPNFFGKDVVLAQGFVSNPTAKKLSGTYCVALFDKDKRLVVCGSLSMIEPIDPGTKNHNLSVVLEATSADLDSVKFAQYRWYVSESKGKEK